jgi:hypothetical protein
MQLVRSEPSLTASPQGHQANNASRKAATILRRVFDWTLVAPSLALCLAAAGLWVRGYWMADTLMWRSGHVVDHDWQRVDYMTRSHRGRLVFWQTGRLMNENELGRDPAAAHAVLQAEPALHYWANESRVFRRAWPAPARGVAGWLGVRWRDSIGGTSAQLGVPVWMIVAVTAIAPGWGLARCVRNRRPQHHSPH